jgi:hypothetical protein
MSILKYVHVPRSLQDSLAQLKRREAVERAYRGLLPAHSTTTTKVQEPSIPKDADTQLSRDSEERLVLESHEITVGNPPHALESLERTHSPNEEGTSYNCIDVEGGAGKARRGSGRIDTVYSEFGEPPRRTSYVGVPLLHTIPQGLQARRLSESVQWLQNVSVPSTVTDSPSVTAPSAGEVFVTASNSPRPLGPIVSTVTNYSKEGGCQVTAIVGSSLVSHRSSRMTSLLPSHIQDLTPELPRSIPGAFPSNDESQRGTQPTALTSQATLSVRSASVNDADQTPLQTDDKIHGVRTQPSCVSVGDRSHKTSNSFQARAVRASLRRR